MKEATKVSIRITSFHSGASPSYHAMRTESNKKTGLMRPALMQPRTVTSPCEMQSEDKDAERKPVHRPYTGFLCT